MSTKTGLNKLYKSHKKGKIAERLGIKYQTMDRWHDQNQMPCTEYNGKTFYSLEIQEMTDGAVTVEELLGFVPHPIQWEIDKRAAK